MLTEQQIKHFHTLGFVIFRQLFNKDELKTIHEEFEAAMDEAYRPRTIRWNPPTLVADDGT